MEAEYDPVERRERYLRTRELKGRDPAKEEEPKLTKEQRRQRAEQRKQKTAASKEISKRRQQETLKIRNLAKSKQQQIASQLKDVLTMLTAATDKREKERVDKKNAKIEKVLKDTKAKLAMVPPIPENVTGPEYEALLRRRQKMINSIEGKATSQIDKINSDYSKERVAANREDAKTKTFVKAVSAARQDQVRKELSASLTKAKANYDTLKKSLK